jgi:hypothetical protein
MSMREPFSVFECSIARRATGRSCTNLRELLDAVRTIPDAVLEHHTIRCALDDHFELHEFPNDLARWCWSTLGDNVLGEQLGLIDPYILFSTAALRETIVNLIEERLWHLDRGPWCRPGYELHLVESRLIAFDTGERINTPMELLDAIERMTLRSLFYHVHEARRRNAGRTDDFSLWLETCEADPALIARIRAIDFYFLNLKQLRSELAAAFRLHTAEPQSPGGGNP